MQPKLDFSKFEFHMFPGKKPSAKIYDLYYKSFRFWRDTWQASYNYFGWDPKSVYSDYWTRQDNIGVLTYDKEIVGTLFFDQGQIGLPGDRPGG